MGYNTALLVSHVDTLPECDRQRYEETSHFAMLHTVIKCQ